MSKGLRFRSPKTRGTTCQAAYSAAFSDNPFVSASCKAIRSTYTLNFKPKTPRPSPKCLDYDCGVTVPTIILQSFPLSLPLSLFSP